MSVLRGVSLRQNKKNMIHTSFTHHATHSRCPQRFYYRYLHRHSDASVEEKVLIQRLACLYGFRELLGHLTHEALAKVVRQIADEGFSESDTAIIRAQMIRDFHQSVGLSRQFQIGSTSGEDLVIAEIINGVDITDQIDDGPTLLAHYFQRGIEVMNLLGLQKGDVVETEVDRELPTHQGLYHLKIDLLLRRKDQVWVIDWKTKTEAGAQDRNQIKLYLEWARRHYKLSPTQLVGMIASLQTGQLQKVLFDIFHPVALTTPPTSDEKKWTPKLSTSGEISTAETSIKQPSYPPNPSREVCVSCPFGSICPAVKSKEVI